MALRQSFLSADDDESRRAARDLRRGTLRLARRLRAERPANGISQLKLNVLAHLSRSGPMSPGELAAAEHIQPQSLTRTLAALEQDRLVTRGDDIKDRRRATLELTMQGRGVLDADMHQRDLWLADTFARHLTPTEQRLLALAGRLMQAIADSEPEQDSTTP